jgi:hypothetical protein
VLTRGYFIDEIVDALSDIAGQVSTRGRLGLTDLNKHAEDFFKTILNHLFSLSLVNLNSERSNEPGLDLGDKTNKVAFQITATRTSAKVNDMLETLSDEQIAAYSKIRVLMIAGKQSSYTLDAGQCARASFSAEDIWDIHDLGKRCMDLTVDVLQLIYNHVHSELARIKIELEIPDADGKYPTTLADFIEAIPKPQMSDLIKFNKLLEEEGVEEDLATTQNAFAAFSAALAKLPRITREFLVMLIERREIDRKHGNSRSRLTRTSWLESLVIRTTLVNCGCWMPTDSFGSTNPTRPAKARTGALSSPACPLRSGFCFFNTWRRMEYL